MIELVKAYICEGCVESFPPKDVDWIRKPTHCYILCKDCQKQRGLEPFRPVRENIPRKKRVIKRQYFKCNKCETITYRDKKKEYTIRQLCCTKCDGFKTLEPIRKPRKKK